MGRGSRVGMSAFVAFIVGVAAILSLLLGDNPALFGEQPGSDELARRLALPGDALLRLVVIIVAVSIVIGIANLLFAHIGRLAQRKLTSAVLLASFAFTIYWYVTRQGDTSLLEAVQVPIESSLAALLFLSLAQGGARVMQKRADIWGMLFVVVVLVVLLGSLPLAELAPVKAWSDWLMAVPVSAGARALLLGMALGAVVAGARALLGQDRSYRG
ncbi:MAG: hypothetical protein OXI30_19495 [Chloroflexota bacterium]|nr:hypothetical protein [Chloroflexota bacterium]